MRMALIVVFEPCRQLRQDRTSVGTIMNIHIVALEGFDERLGHAVGLRALYRGEARNETQADRELGRFVSSIAEAVVREPLGRRRNSSPKRRSTLSTIRSRIISC
jgi:hypothetical protein